MHEITSDDNLLQCRHIAWNCSLLVKLASFPDTLRNWLIVTYCTLSSTLFIRTNNQFWLNSSSVVAECSILILFIIIRQRLIRWLYSVLLKISIFTLSRAHTHYEFAKQHVTAQLHCLSALFLSIESVQYDKYTYIFNLLLSLSPLLPACHCRQLISI